LVALLAPPWSTTAVQPPAQSLRQRLRETLRDGSYTLRDLSVMLSATEREIVGHLPHVQRSAQGRGERFVIEPAQCSSCSFVFEQRTRLTTPSRCPECRSERIEAPRFGVAT